MPPQLDVIALVVADMGRSLTFYRRLGLEIPADSDGDPHVEALLPGGLRLAWDTAEMTSSIDPSWSMPTGHGRITLAFRCENPAEVDSAYAEMTEAGYTGHLKPWDAFWGQRYATLLDPDGNGVDLFAPLT
ncbi:VOC family protein [Micromonospora sp. NBC_01796]|uniref:VOC family protein n=1 Tax=Micromonospora sp. NBC_01796 TaxID=2975987 RepID=UPI002DDC8A24|nr:VOC family protein [Micromonospora sp. NBC_01796]WSA85384.1 VOC family protein [Micromonospora sp. NBC_01796]